MMGFSHMRPPAFGGTLERRRLLDRCRRLLVAATVGLAVFSILQCVRSVVATQTVLVAAAPIVRGQVIRAGDLTLSTVPASDTFAGVLRRVSDAEGRVAQSDLDRGMPVLSTVVTDRPATPDGYTVIDVRLSGGWEGLAPGDAVSLSASGVCDRLAPESSGGDGGCAVASHALVMGMPDEPEGASGTALAPLALPSDDALRVLELQDQGVIVAVATGQR